ncbi:uncharacterized protein Z518_08528 [Rhinocladiella mackenziei CBS 650.93]|uniref:Uncharacterized protein n=1 Tax=Rhinocladiella mackenziei CBS 650.93 TaxID=1442369 RepID=A0A0D2FKX5_9EURO|nr:uncharacterized protein Z518_08528 [Rhinocladiella mackenziei CBS 650.93]KIX02587.1 hypothetical protein Z518_08528 [Rhinocladiella mackenziei CBS 650.93]
MVTLIAVGLFIWIPLFFESMSPRAKIAVATVAIVHQEVSGIATLGPGIKKRLHLEYSTAADIGREIDRLPAFYIIVLGGYLYSMIVGNPAAMGLNMDLLKAVWTLIIAFCLNRLYVNGIESVHSIRRSATTTFVFFDLHMPLAASLAAGGHVCATSAGDDKGESIMTKTIRIGMRLVAGVILILLPLVDEEHFDAV